MHKICIYDRRLPLDIVNNLGSMGFILVPTLDLETTDSAIDTHPDIQVCKIRSSFIVTEPRVYDHYEKNLSKYGIIVRQGNAEVGNGYPQDSFYNAAVGNGMIIHDPSSTDTAILDETSDLNRVDVKQGYTKCNVVFTKGGVITSDMGIYKSIDLPKLIVSAGSIKLDGFNYGFIGGASGYYDGAVYFIGDIKCHPDYFKILDFLDREDTEIVSLYNGELLDYGSLIFLEGL